MFNLILIQIVYIQTYIIFAESKFCIEKTNGLLIINGNEYKYNITNTSNVSIIFGYKLNQCFLCLCRLYFGKVLYFCK